MSAGETEMTWIDCRNCEVSAFLDYETLTTQYYRNYYQKPGFKGPPFFKDVNWDKLQYGSPEWRMIPANLPSSKPLHSLPKSSCI